DGPGALGAIRHAILGLIEARLSGVAAMDSELVVLARGETERLLPRQRPILPWVRVVGDEQSLVTEVEAVCVRQARLQAEHEDSAGASDGAYRRPYLALVVVVPGPLDEATARAVGSARSRVGSLRVFAVGGTGDRA